MADYTVSSSTGGLGGGQKNIVILTRTINFAAASSGGDGNLASATVANIFNIPTNTIVIGGYARTKTAQANAGTAGTVGDGDDADGYLTALNASAVTLAAFNGSFVATNAGKAYAATTVPADTIDFTSGATPLTSAVIEFGAYCVRANS